MHTEDKYFFYGYIVKVQYISVNYELNSAK